MRQLMFAALAAMCVGGSAFAQSAMPAGQMTPVAPAKKPVAADTTHPAHAASAKPADASTAESHSAAALALSREPTFDEGTAERIKEAALSYSDIAVRGGWPTIPADANLQSGLQAPMTTSCASG